MLLAAGVAHEKRNPRYSVVCVWGVAGMGCTVMDNPDLHQ
jgi:hypothetical protein